MILALGRPTRLPVYLWVPFSSPQSHPAFCRGCVVAHEQVVRGLQEAVTQYDVSPFPVPRARLSSRRVPAVVAV